MKVKQLSLWDFPIYTYRVFAGELDRTPIMINAESEEEVKKILVKQNNKLFEDSEGNLVIDFEGNKIKMSIEKVDMEVKGILNFI